MLYPSFQSLPLFPLRSVLFPGGFLALQIFEVRYLDMIGKCHRAGTPFGVVALIEGSEVRQIAKNPGAAGDGGAPDQPTAPTGDAFANEVFHTIGTLARITEFSATQPGLITVECLGTQRFEMTRSEKLRHGLWVADATCLPDDQRVTVPADLRGPGLALLRLIDVLVAQGLTAEQMPIKAPLETDDCAWVANRWCELLNLPTVQKQRLMVLDNPLLRLELVRDILESHAA